ncbi:MAG: septal ring lytic transglycosylase RlpA family protein [Flavobacteriaceae bacterium]
MIASRSRIFVGIFAACALAAACSGPTDTTRVDSKYGVSASPRVADTDKPIPKGGGVYKVGNPYKVAGRTYVPKEQPGYDSVGMASWYGDAFHGRLTANGEVYDMNAFSAAHPTLPLPSYVRVTNLENRRSVVVRVNDRGPYAHDRIIDLSRHTAELLDFHQQGLTKVRVQYVGRAPLEGDDSGWLTTTARIEDGTNSSTLLAATLPPAPASVPEPRPIFAFVSSTPPTPRVGVGQPAGSGRRQGVLAALSGYAAFGEARRPIDDAFAAFQPQTMPDLPAEYRDATRQ